MNALKNGTTLQGGKYRIISTLGQGGFGITYLAENVMLQGKVAIKEFFFKDYCDRNDVTSHVTIPTSGNRDTVLRFRQKFVKEARTIFRLSHPNIVRILDVFEENDTAYYVMEYIEGESLADMVKRRGAIPEAEALGYIRQAAHALNYIHSQNINHLDVKPGNLIRRSSDGRVLLIDFGVAKQYDATTAEGTTTTPVCISAGYSPAEQYLQKGVQSFSPQSDVYALAATLYKLLTGVTPPEAMEVMSEGLPADPLLAKSISNPVRLAIAMAMKGRRDRTQTVTDFLQSLTQAGAKDADSTELTQIQESTPEVSENLTFEVNGVKFDMVRVEGGTFRMGATREQGSDVGDDEKPVHDVTLDSYYIGKTQVTQALWKAVMVDETGVDKSKKSLWKRLWSGSGVPNPSYFKGDDLPVECVSWNDCQKFITKLNRLTGKNFRLPTEAEWEFACRGGNNSRVYKYSGSNNIDDVAWYEDNSSSRTHPVGTKAPNELGIYDMSGNVWEWCSDWYGNYSANQQWNPAGPTSGSNRVRRGGSCNYFARCCRSSFRGNRTPSRRLIDLGLRLAL